MQKLQHPFTCIVSGPTGSGKTVFCTKFINNLPSICTEQNFEEILWCYSENASLPLKQFTRDVKFLKGVPKFSNEKKNSKLVILDDLLNEAYSRDVCDLFTKGSHHRNISVILITQNLFHQSRFARDISLNAKYIVIFKNTRDKSQFQYLARQVYPENPASLYEKYLEATQSPHGYILLDLAQDTPDLIRFRTNIFPPDITVVFAPVKNNEDKIQLP